MINDIRESEKKKFSITLKMSSLERILAHRATDPFYKDVIPNRDLPHSVEQKVTFNM